MQAASNNRGEPETVYNRDNLPPNYAESGPHRGQHHQPRAQNVQFQNYGGAEAEPQIYPGSMYNIDAEGSYGVGGLTPEMKKKVALYCLYGALGFFVVALLMIL
eukprot:TRINITY_DN22005_c0_g1_i1.p2 TRINITY_DN22005_c0_g1~~TRINITY_DN22005_c0_g1_i1.p2  ORF type:complete len:104 (-),score=10.62 TRINITY_DN22005_c0_g1_i1:33-344(-)